MLSLSDSRETVRRIVLDSIAEAGETGVTADQLVQVLGSFHNTVAPRITELSQDGLIQDSGERRPTRFGRPAIVWTAVREAEDE